MNHENLIKIYDIFYKNNLMYFALEVGILDLEKLINQQRKIILEPSHIKCLA